MSTPNTANKINQLCGKIKNLNTELNEFKTRIDNVKKVSTVAEASECIAVQPSNSIQDSFFITRNSGAVCSGQLFEGNPNGLVRIAENWDLSTNGPMGDYLWVFSKTLQHDATTYLPDRDQVDQVLDFFTDPTFEKLNNLPSSTTSTRLLEDPAGGLGFEPISKHQSLIMSEEYIPINSARGVMEMTEVYCMALGRDLKISDLNSSADPTTITLYPNGCDGSTGASGSVSAQRILDHLNNYTSTTSVIPNWPLNGTGQTDLSLIFRGNSPDEDIGQYISQFLILDVPFANGSFEQKYAPECDTIGSVTEAGYLSIQNGEEILTNTKLPSRRIQTLRDLGSLVHNDPAYGLYFNAGLIAARAGLDALKDGGNGSNFLDTGGPDYLTTIGAVTRAALRTAWVTKWQSDLKIRPENAAGRLAWLDANPSAKTGDLETWYNYFSTDLLDDMKDWNDGLVTGTGTGSLPFLPLLFPEGSPTHPAFPAGHATVAGACVTVIKAFVKTHDSLNNAISWTSVFGDVQRVDDTTGNLVNAPDSGETIIGELNKLASNPSLGRNIAGVHYRCDGDCGIRMGEEVAISYLKEMTGSYYPDIISDKIEFNLQKFDGTFIKILNGTVV